MAQSDLSAKDRRGAIGASSSRSHLGDSHCETPNEVRKRTAFVYNLKLEQLIHRMINHSLVLIFKPI